MAARRGFRVVPAATHYSNGADCTVTATVQGTAQQFNAGAAVVADWWPLFHSPQLDAVIQEAIANNPGLDAAQASLRASQHNLRSGYGIFYPAIDADAGAARERFSPTNFGESVPGSVFNLFTLSATVSYALDVFGGQRRLVEGLRAQVDVAHAGQPAVRSGAPTPRYLGGRGDRARGQREHRGGDGRAAAG